MTFSPAQVEQLLRPVNPRRVQRDNHGMSHLAAYDVSAHLTRIFGFGGWSKHILVLELVAEDAIKDPQRDRIGWYVTYRCLMRLVVRSHDGFDWENEDGATGSASNLPDRGDAHDFALKNAISYALKRCAKDLGDQFGLSLYNKGSTKALVGKTLTGSPDQIHLLTPSIEDGVPDLAPDWDEAPPGRADGSCQCGHPKHKHRTDVEPPGCDRCDCRLAWNADGSLSRSRTTDEQKECAGVMTAAQQAEHTALQPKQAEIRGKVTRLPTTPDDDPWLLDGTEDHPGTISAKQQRAMHNACRGMDRDARLATISDIVGRQVTSSNELSYVEAAAVLGKLSGTPA